ncbi:hypothetical protein F8388_003975 [Cannabis sativa]|uniref:Uncharacterized protein n=1 Tax=Cannabis sativa TaxID=3483 RepID=A0A7J6GPH1_CANSA|nr:hypothetical protein F8388_003975 [Cannabis sativa]
MVTCAGSYYHDQEHVVNHETRDFNSDFFNTNLERIKSRETKFVFCVNLYHQLKQITIPFCPFLFGFFSPSNLHELFQSHYDDDDDGVDVELRSILFHMFWYPSSIGATKHACTLSSVIFKSKAMNLFPSSNSMSPSSLNNIPAPTWYQSPLTTVSNGLRTQPRTFGRGSYPSSRLICQVCMKSGHTAAVCHYRFDKSWVTPKPNVSAPRADPTIPTSMPLSPNNDLSTLPTVPSNTNPTSPLDRSPTIHVSLNTLPLPNVPDATTSHHPPPNVYSEKVLVQPQGEQNSCSKSGTVSISAELSINFLKMFDETWFHATPKSIATTEKESKKE